MAEISQRFNDALIATAAAIVNTLPTLTPIPDLSPYKAEDRQKTDLWREAQLTSIALNPTPPGFDPGSFIPTVPPHTPWPTTVIPKRPLTDGTLYNVPAQDPPCNVMRASNLWMGRITGVEMRICAGRTKDFRSDTGRVIVDTFTGDPANPDHYDFYQPPPAFGAIWIVDIQGTQVILQSTSGQQLAFDVITHEWATPTPGPSPSQSPLASPSAGPSATP